MDLDNLLIEVLEDHMRIIIANPARPNTREMPLALLDHRKKLADELGRFVHRKIAEHGKGSAS
jgi:hypothetical protein